ncbi:hypothetical protein CC78DRAFT_569800 [Lojkania enalia]|uniref:C3H1-type domain-containing protein n=1 Tax=Lojkania enalia TaxID=147567 RepID=A0A9P4N7L1_9PLEO|nr:hypothetical protein CC78DRAFT_569800 [Didymosphaeria enalia]
MDSLILRLFDINGGVCGCPEFWGLPSNSPSTSQHQKPTSHTTGQGSLQRSLVPHTDSPASSLERHLLSLSSIIPPPSPHPRSSPASSNDLRSPSPTPCGPPRKTCFYWYHGWDCKKGDMCDYAHKLHITWQIPVPNGLVHKRPCYLSLCPLRQGFKELRNGTRGIGSGRKARANLYRVRDAELHEASEKLDPDDVERFVMGRDMLLDSGSDGSGDCETGLIYLDENGSANWPRTSERKKSPPPSPLNEVVATISHPGTRKHHSTDPRALETKKACFYWYHQGICRPSPGKSCPCQHPFSTPAKKVNWPYSIKSHDCRCPLALCPARLAAEKRDMEHQKSVNGGGVATRDTISSVESTLGNKSARPHNITSSVPLPKRPKLSTTLSRHRHERTPMSILTDQKAARFKYQKFVIKNWQARNGVVCSKHEAEAVEEGIKQRRRAMMKQGRKKRQQEARKKLSEQQYESRC